MMFNSRGCAFYVHLNQEDRSFVFARSSAQVHSAEAHQANYINALAVSVLPLFEPAKPITLGGFFVTLGGFVYDIG
jgi:hypothetical protein